MVKTHFPRMDLEKVAKVGPKGPNGKEIMPKVNYEKVTPFVRISKKDFGSISL